MNKRKWLVLAAALGMMAATGVYLVSVHQRLRLGEPGVKVGPGLLYDEHGQLAARECVLLPDTVSGMKGTNLAVWQSELESLPKDTTFGRKLYSHTDHFDVQASVVLMKSDRTSIHDPHYCLTAQDWHIEKTDKVLLSIDRPHPYELPAIKLTASRGGRSGIYIYWFVSADHLTSDQGTRMWSLAWTMLQKGVLERWAYISYFATCFPGEEEATFDKLVRFIRASAPEFQTVAGPSFAGRSSAAPP
jgi:hypothetical protein